MTGTRDKAAAQVRQSAAKVTDTFIRPEIIFDEKIDLSMIAILPARASPIRAHAASL
jgi:hypothetical protein